MCGPWDQNSEKKKKQVKSSLCILLCILESQMSSALSLHSQIRMIIRSSEDHCEDWRKQWLSLLVNAFSGIVCFGYNKGSETSLGFRPTFLCHLGRITLPLWESYPNFLKLGGVSDYLTVLPKIAITEGGWVFHVISIVTWLSISFILNLLLWKVKLKKLKLTCDRCSNLQKGLEKLNYPIYQTDLIFLCFVVFSGIMERQNSYLSLLSVLGCSIIGKSNDLSTLPALLTKQALDTDLWIQILVHHLLAVQQPRAKRYVLWHLVSNSCKALSLGLWEKLSECWLLLVLLCSFPFVLGFPVLRVEAEYSSVKEQ